MKTLAIATCALTFGLTSFGGLTDGLVAHYKFDGTAKDATANQNNGVVQGATLTADRFGKANSAYLFGGDDWIEVPSSPSLQSVTRKMTFSAWIKPDSAFWGFFPILCKGIVGRQFGFTLQLTRGGDTILINDRCGRRSRSGRDVKLQVPSWTCDKKVWYHIAVTYDGNTLKAYCNGQYIGTADVEDR